LEQQERRLATPLADGWTLDAVAFAGPNRADWQVLMAHQDGIYRVVQTRPSPTGAPPIEKEWYSGENNDAATEVYLLAVGSMTREAQGLPSAAG
jgi:hypothetical protein